MNFDVLNDKLKEDVRKSISRTIGGFKGQKNNSQKWSLTHSFKNALIFANEGGEVMEVTLEDTDGVRFILLKTQIDNYEGRVIYDIKRDTLNTDLPNMIDYYMYVLKAKDSVNKLISEFYGFSKYADMLEDLEEKMSDMFSEFGDDGYYEQQIYLLAELLGYDEKDLLSLRIELQL